MATADEILAQIGTTKNQASEAQVGAQQAGNSAAEFGQQLQGMGVEDKAQVAHTCSEQINRGQTLMAQAIAELEQAEVTAAKLKNS